MKKLILFLMLLCLFLFTKEAQAQVKIGWDSYTDPKATEFRVYVSVYSMGVVVPIKISPTSLTEYQLLAAQTTTNPVIYIRMTAYDGINKVESLPTYEIRYNKTVTKLENLRIQ